MTNLQTVLEKKLLVLLSQLSLSRVHSQLRKFISHCNSLLLLKMHLFSVFAFAASVAAQKCPLQFDGRVPRDATLATFDGSSSPFNAQYVLGASKYSRTTIGYLI